MLNRTEIHKLGKRIRESYGDGTGKVEVADLEMLQEYRLSYRDIIAEVFKILYDTGKRVDSQCIVTYRIKRINSIVEKLKRYPTTAFEHMVDIAGCRCITGDTKQVYKIVRKLRENPALIIKDKDKEKGDYIQNPKPDGYRSVHLYVSLTNGDGKQVEIQIRDREQHNWATLVEISDVIIPGARLKEYHTPADLLEFHRILSLPEEKLTLEEKRTYFKILDEYDYINLLQKVFLQNTFIRYQWLNTKSSRIKNFYLIEAGVGAKTKINCYQTFQDAENAYFERFKQDRNANIVLTQIQNVTYEQLSMAYSNYVLSTHSFVSDCMNRYLKEIRNALNNRDIKLYKRLLNSYFNAVAQQIIRINQEIYTINHTLDTVHDQKKRDWIQDLRRQIAQLDGRRDRLITIYQGSMRSIDNPIFHLMCHIITKRLGKKYQKLVQNNIPQ